MEDGARSPTGGLSSLIGTGSPPPVGGSFPNPGGSRNGGDRQHEARLNRVVEAYQLLRKSGAFVSGAK